MVWSGRLAARTAELVTANAGLQAEIAQRQHAEESLRESRAFLQSVIDAATDATMVIDRSRRIVLANRTAREAGSDEPVANAVTCHQLCHHSPRPCRGRAHPCPMERVIETRTAVVVEHVHVDAEGNQSFVEVTAAPIFDSAGEVIQIVHSCRDITERKRSEEERRQLQAQILQAQKLESLGVLAGGIAHDFNNLLVGVLGYASLALDELAADSPIRHMIERIETSARRAADLTRQMLAYSGKGRFIMETIDLSILVEEMTELMTTSISKKAQLECEFAEDLPAIDADPTQVRQVVMNLITNASEALGEADGLITIRTGVTSVQAAELGEPALDGELPGGRYVFVEVSDSGCGMDDPTRAKIFEPFFTTKFTGRGLGLAAVQGIVRGHRGAVQLTSAPEGGTTFRVLFPASTRATPPADAEEAPSVTQSRSEGTVLVVDDEDAVRQLATTALERSGLNVLGAVDGRQALEVFRRHSHEIDAVLLDSRMPHLNGTEVLPELRRLRPDVPVIFTSGYDEQETMSSVVGDSLTGFIQKPYRPSELIRKLHEIMPAPRPVLERT